MYKALEQPAVLLEFLEGREHYRRDGKQNEKHGRKTDCPAFQEFLYDIDSFFHSK